MKGRLKKIREWAHTPKFLLLLVFIYSGDYVSRVYISQKNEFEVVGCVQKVTFGSGRGAAAGLDILTTQDKEEHVITLNWTLIREMENHIGECFSFTVYKHSFLIPNIGDQWLVNVNPIDTNNKGEI